MATHQAVFNATLKITQYMMNSVAQDGSWATVDYTDWGPIITALNVEHLLNCGMTIDDEWKITKEQNLYHCSIKHCIDYLSKNIKDNGSFGADFWDTCKLATLIVQHNLQNYFEYEKIHNYIIDFINTGGLEIQADDYSQSAEWSGPGTYAACAYYLLCINERTLADKVISDALAMQQSDGSFVGKKNRTGDNVINPIWHTAQMLRVILKSRYSNNAELIQKITRWIETVQGNDGEYDDFGQFVTYYTSYAALAFLDLPQRPQPYTERTIDYLLSKMKDGKVDDFGGTIMAAQAFSAYLGPNDLSSIFKEIEISCAKELIEENKELKNQNEHLKQLLSDLSKKYSDADIVLSKKDAWKFGLWFGVITLILGIIVPILINTIGTYVFEYGLDFKTDTNDILNLLHLLKEGLF